MSDVTNCWKEFLNPDVVRTKFVTMGLFMIAHEMLLDAIKNPPRRFFANSQSAEGGWQESDEYRREILDRDPKRRCDPLRGSLAWLREMDAIDEADVAAVRKFTDARNMIAHELRYIVEGSRMPDFAGLFPRLVDLMAKIDRWWIINVENATEPDLAGQELNVDDVTPGSILIMQILSRVALGEDDEAWELYRAFVERTGSNSATDG